MKKIFIALVGMTIALPPAFAATWYVSPSGSDANNGSSWVLAKKTIQAGVNAAASNDTVLITNGTYILTNQVSITNGITVKSVNGASSTIVNGNYPVTTNRCFYIKNLAYAIIDGFVKALLKCPLV